MNDYVRHFRFFQFLIRAKVPAPVYYWLLDRLTDNNGWRPLSYREGQRRGPGTRRTTSRY